MVPQLTQYVQGVTVISADGMNTFEQTCDTFDDLRAFSGATGQQIYTRGGAAAGDGLQGVFYWNSFGSGTDDGVNNIVPAAGGGQWTRIPISFVDTPFAGVGIGTSVGDLVQLVNDDGVAALPAVSGALLTDLPASETSLQGIVGSGRGINMTVATANASANLTADQICVSTSLSGPSKFLASYNQNINLGATGAGGMDIGSAPISGYVSLYAIAGVSGASTLTSILASSTATSVSPIYTGGNMPPGYTYSGLVGVWPTDGSGNFVVGALRGREMSRVGVTVLANSSTIVSSLTSLDISSAVPVNAVMVSGELQMGSTVTANLIVAAAGTSNGVGSQQINHSGTGLAAGFESPIVTPQTLFYSATCSSGTPTFSIVISRYEF